MFAIRLELIQISKKKIGVIAKELLSMKTIRNTENL